MGQVLPPPQRKNPGAQNACDRACTFLPVVFRAKFPRFDFRALEFDQNQFRYVLSSICKLSEPEQTNEKGLNELILFNLCLLQFCLS